MDDSAVSESGGRALPGVAYAPERESNTERDRELITRSLSGDEDAFAEIVGTFQKRVYGLALRMTRRHEVADDVAQETFIRAYRNLDRFELGRPLAPWLLRIARNLAINHFHSKASREQALYTEDMPDGPETVLQRIRQGGDDTDPHQSLQSLEFSQAFEAALSKLSPEYRAVLMLRIAEDMRYDEIAQELDISKGTVMSRLFRARAKLKTILKDYL